MHHYYHSDGMTDLDVLRSDARARSGGKGIHVQYPEASILHLHPAREMVNGEPKDIACVGHKHEKYNMLGVMEEFVAEEVAQPSIKLKLVEIERTKDEIVWRVEAGGVFQAREFDLDEFYDGLNEAGIDGSLVRLFIHSPVVGEPSIRAVMDIRQ